MADRSHSPDPMLQAEVGGGARIDLDQRLQRPGYLIRDFVSNSIHGQRIQVSDYRGRANLLLVFVGSPTTSHELLRDLAGRAQLFAEQDCVIILVFPSSAEKAELLWTEGKSLVLLVDKGDRLHKLYGAVDGGGSPVPVIYITDRFGEIVSVQQIFSGEQLPCIEEILKLLEFTNHQCPECAPPEWPG